MQSGLSRREREIVDILYRMGEGSARDVAARVADDPGYDSVRVLLGILEKKGHVTHRKDGRQKVYRPTVSKERAGRQAAEDLFRTFFTGSPKKGILTMLDVSSTKLSRAELEEIEAWLERERKRR